MRKQSKFTAIDEVAKEISRNAGCGARTQTCVSESENAGNTALREINKQEEEILI